MVLTKETKEAENGCIVPPNGYEDQILFILRITDTAPCFRLPSGSVTGDMHQGMPWTDMPIVYICSPDRYTAMLNAG